MKLKVSVDTSSGVPVYYVFNVEVSRTVFGKALAFNAREASRRIRALQKRQARFDNVHNFVDGNKFALLPKD